MDKERFSTLKVEADAILEHFKINEEGPDEFTLAKLGRVFAEMYRMILQEQWRLARLNWRRQL